MRIDEAGWDIAANQRLQGILQALREGTGAWTMDDFRQYLRFYKRRSKKTVAQYVAQLNFMARHPLFPVNLFGTRAQLIETFSMYVTAREEIEGFGAAALKTDHRAVRALGSFLGIPPNVWPVAPKTVKRESQWVPSPEQVYELLRAQFGTTRSYEHQLVRYMLAYSFGIGIRPPSEWWTADVNDVDLENGILIVQEMKKGGPRRELVVEPRWLVDSPNRLSLKNWIEGPRQMCSPETTALFPNVDGTAFASKEAMAAFVVRHVCGDVRKDWRCWDEDEARPGPRFEWYNPYVARHWSVNARLIDSMREIQGQKVYDWNAVVKWHGHEDVKMTMGTYARAVEVNERKYGRDWITRAFGRPRKTA